MDRVDALDAAHMVVDALDRIYEELPGLTRRDYFAAAALTGLAASHNSRDKGDAAILAQDAYRLADAMIARGGE